MKQHKLFYGSSYDRGLDVVLKLWPQILFKFPDATLDIAYGWDLFIMGYKDNPERLNWMDRMNKQMEQKGITHHGRVGKDKLAKIRKQCGIWVYPTYFAEINCITALEAQNDGLVPVTMNSFALKETVGTGIKIDGDIYDQETKDAWIKGLFKIMKLSQPQFELIQKSAKHFSSNYSWDKIASDWSKYL